MKDLAPPSGQVACYAAPFTPKQEKKTHFHYFSLRLSSKHGKCFSNLLLAVMKTL